MRGLAPLLQVFHMPTAVHFYRDLLGFKVTGSSKMMGDDPDDVGWVMLEKNDALLMLNTAYDPEETPAAPDAPRWSGHQDTGLFIGVEDVDGAYEYLMSKGLKVSPPKNAYYGMRQIYLTDPDGFGICFQWPVKTGSEQPVSAQAGT